METDPMNEHSQNPIFITGATGSLGRHLTGELKNRARVRAGIQNHEKDSAALMQGIETVAFNFNDPELMAMCFRDCRVLFLLTGDTEIFDRQVLTALESARQAGVEHVVRLSSISLSSHPNDACVQMHRKGEEYVKSSGMKWTILKPNYFMDNIIHTQGKTILEHGRFYGSAGQGKISFVSSADIAACAAQILINPEQHHGKTYRLTGPEALSYGQLAEILSELLNQQIQYINIGQEQLAEGFRANGMADWLIESIVSNEVCVREGKFENISDDVNSIISRVPENYRNFLSREFKPGKIDPAGEKEKH